MSRFVLSAMTVLLLVIIQSSSNKKLQPVLFTNNRVYALMNQHTGSYLTVGENGSVHRSHDQGMHSEEQLWRVLAINKEGFQLVPSNGEIGPNTIWKPMYLGHGNYQLQNLDSDTCLDASAIDKEETPCSKENLYQQWFPTLKDL